MRACSFVLWSVCLTLLACLACAAGAAQPTVTLARADSARNKR